MIKFSYFSFYLFLGCNVSCLKLWGPNRAGPYFTALYFFFGIGKTRQVSSMIHSARPTVSPVANIVFDPPGHDRIGGHYFHQWCPLGQPHSPGQ